MGQINVSICSRLVRGINKKMVLKRANIDYGPYLNNIKGVRCGSELALACIVSSETNPTIPN